MKSYFQEVTHRNMCVCPESLIRSLIIHKRINIIQACVHKELSLLSRRIHTHTIGKFLVGEDSHSDEWGSQNSSRCRHVSHGALWMDFLFAHREVGVFPLREKVQSLVEFLIWVYTMRLMRKVQMF